MAAEASALQKTLIEYLSTLFHLTLSFDGWTSQVHDDIYMVHITTAIQRSFLVGGLVLTSESVTSELLSMKLIELILIYGAAAFSIVVSDTTGNVKKAQELICAKFPWILNCGDPCHQLNLMVKDLIVGSKRHPKIKPFADIISAISTITTYFSHSNYGQLWL
ncbi:hypothetical protein IW261DRAFT_1416205 [Armillaria novae-zelandiae]|uniref:DUF659 domain-containing protein n=1 Tax=Armillaria novae-zelandiae TaxID=153914 RepID=A0AA39PM88_9AGAR|nr:hypothetical protein IW261DRAFT_1416205 [Armillaria novae-zelandiae]